jgi:hypothetical protein
MQIDAGASCPSKVVEGLRGAYAHWARVPVGGSGATIILTTSASRGGRADVFAGEARVIVANGCDEENSAFASIRIPPHAVLYARVRERGVSLLVGSRATAATGAPTLVYYRHWSAGNFVMLSRYRAPIPDVPLDPDRSTSYSLPVACMTVARHGTLATALAEAETASWKSGSAPPDLEPPGSIDCLPRDAVQIANEVARELQRS